MNMSFKLLELCLMDACLSIFSLMNSGEAQSLNIIRLGWMIAVENITTIHFWTYIIL